MESDPSQMVENGFTDEFIKLTHDFTGITIKPEKRSMLEGRLRKRLRELELADFTAYLAYVKNNPAEREYFVNAVTTNETYFYRTPRIWEYISEQFLLEWHDNVISRPLSVWSAASSTGEEAHTLGIILQSFKDKHAGFDYKVKGTDIDSSVVERARQGVYKGRAIQRFKEAKPDLFKQYMVGNDDNGYKVLPDIKSRLDFSVLNLFDKNQNKEKYDLVLLRNVLIYFVKEDQIAAVAAVHKRLHTDGVAIIGESESLNNLPSDFEPIAPTIYKALPIDSGRKAA